MDQIEKADYRNSVRRVWGWGGWGGGELSWSLRVVYYVQEDHVLILSLSIYIYTHTHTHTHTHICIYTHTCVRVCVQEDQVSVSLCIHTHTHTHTYVQEDQVLISRLWYLRFLNFVNPGPIDHSAFVCQHGL